MRRGSDNASASAFISRFTQWAQQRPDITAAALVGSLARGTARPDSDVDLVVVADDPASYLADTAWTRAFGSVERMNREGWGAVQSLRVFYANGLEVEFGFASFQWASTRPVDEESARVIRDGAMILVDKQLRLAQLASSVETANMRFGMNEIETPAAKQKMFPGREAVMRSVFSWSADSARPVRT